jgi:hypothetical protein
MPDLRAVFWIHGRDERARLRQCVSILHPKLFAPWLVKKIRPLLIICGMVGIIPHRHHPSRVTASECTRKPRRETHPPGPLSRSSRPPRLFISRARRTHSSSCPAPPALRSRVVPDVSD